VTSHGAHDITVHLLAPRPTAPISKRTLRVGPLHRAGAQDRGWIRHRGRTAPAMASSSTGRGWRPAARSEIPLASKPGVRTASQIRLRLSDMANLAVPKRAATNRYRRLRTERSARITAMAPVALATRGLISISFNSGICSVSRAKAAHDVCNGGSDHGASPLTPRGAAPSQLVQTWQAPRWAIRGRVVPRCP